MNGYPRDIFCNHVNKFLIEKLMTINSSQNINDEKKYTVIIPFIGHPSITLKKSLSKNLIMKLHWPYKQMSFIFLKVLVIRTKPILVKLKDIWQLGLGSIF